MANNKQKKKPVEKVDCDTQFPVQKLTCIAFLGVIAALAISYLFVVKPPFLVPEEEGKYAIFSHSPEFEELIAKDAVVEVVSKDAFKFKWVEGPVWVSCKKSQGYLLFSDVCENTIYKWQEGKSGDHKTSIFLTGSGHDGDPSSWKFWKEPGSNGLAIDTVSGRLLIAEHFNRRISVLVEVKPDQRSQLNAHTLEALKAKFGTSTWYLKQPVVMEFEGRGFNSPNDFAITKNGNFYFTDPPYGLQDYTEQGQLEDHPARDMEYSGVFLVKRGKPGAFLVNRNMTRPNGIGLSPDENFLYVANSDAKDIHIQIFDLRTNGSIKEGRVFVNFTKSIIAKEQEREVKFAIGPGIADGLKVAPTGHVFASGPSGIYVFDPQGKHLGTIHVALGRQLLTGNCAFGEDGWLYIAATDRILRVKTKLKFKHPKAHEEYC